MYRFLFIVVLLGVASGQECCARVPGNWSEPPACDYVSTLLHEWDVLIETDMFAIWNSTMYHG